MVYKKDHGDFHASFRLDSLTRHLRHDNVKYGSFTLKRDIEPCFSLVWLQRASVADG